MSRLLLKPIKCWPSQKMWLGLGLGLGLALLCSLVLRPLTPTPVIYAALLWVQAQGAAGVLAYVLIYNLATLACVPGVVLTLGGGAIYGPLWGSLYAVIAATLGATLAFGIGRRMASGAGGGRLRWPFGSVFAPSHPYVQVLNAAVARSGFKIVLLTRLSPILPFNLLNYAYGVTQVSWKDYMLGSLGLVPGTVLYVYMGALAGDIANLGSQPTPQAQFMQGLLNVLGLLATLAVTVAIARQARHTLQQTVPPPLPPTKL